MAAEPQGSEGSMGKVNARSAGEGALPFGQKIVFADAQGASAPMALRVVVAADAAWTRLRREGSEGSEGCGIAASRR